MKRGIFFIFLAIIATCCQPSTSPQTKITEKEGVNILYFHGEHHCKTCEAIEKNTQIVINQYFTQEVSEGKLSFQIIDFSKSENEAIADSYQIAWDALLIVSKQGEQKEVIDLTNFAVTHALGQPQQFQKHLQEVIIQVLS